MKKILITILFCLVTVSFIAEYVAFQDYSLEYVFEKDNEEKGKNDPLKEKKEEFLKKYIPCYNITSAPPEDISNDYFINDLRYSPGFLDSLYNPPDIA